MILRASCLVLVTFAFVACETKKQPDVVEPAPAEDGRAAIEEPAPEPPKKSSSQCVGPIRGGDPVELTVGKQVWVKEGSTLRAKRGLKKKKLVVGVLTDVKEDSEENLANLDFFVATFRKAKADLVVVAGDSGMNKAQLIGTLAKIASVGVPVFNIAGNREGKADYVEAMKEVSAAHPNVFDLNQIRRVDTPFADFVSMPGYFNPSYIHAEDGCQYFQADVDALDALVKASDSPAVLVSHGGPQQKGPQALDRTAEGANVGDAMLTKSIENNAIKFGIFGNIHEAGGRATDFAGENVLAEGKRHSSLFLNPGPADAVAWQMNDGTDSIGMAALLTFDAQGQASYQVERIPEPAEPVVEKP